MWQLGPWRQSVSTSNPFPLGLVFLLVGSAGSSSKPMHVCVPQVHPSRSALHKAPSLNLHPFKSVASFWSCTIISMHCHWFYLLKSNCAFPEYSHQLCLLFLYYMLHYTITIILLTYLLVNNASNTRLWPCFGISFLMSLATMHVMSEEQHCFYCLTWTSFSEKTASVCIFYWCFYALFLLGMYLRLGCLSGMPTHMIMLFLFFVCVRFLKNLPSAFLPWNTVREESYTLKMLWIRFWTRTYTSIPSLCG